MTSDLPLIYSPTHATTITRHSDSFLTNLFHNNERLGEMVLAPQSLDDYWSQVYGNELRITSFSTSSERCLPILVLHTIAPGVAFKLAPPDGHKAADLPALQALHSSCLHENKVLTSLMIILHLSNVRHRLVFLSLILVSFVDTTTHARTLLRWF